MLATWYDAALRSCVSVSVSRTHNRRHFHTYLACECQIHRAQWTAPVRTDCPTVHVIVSAEGSTAVLDKQEFSRSKQFPSPAKQPVGKRTEAAVEERKESQLLQHSEAAAASNAQSDDSSLLAPFPAPSVEELMDDEFGRIIGHDSIKQQLRQFYKKVQLDRIRAAHGKEKDTKRLYHMIFSGPPGTGNQQHTHDTATERTASRRWMAVTD